MTHASDTESAPLADFAGIYDAHAQDLRRFALYLSGDAALTDDLVSEAFVRAWTAWDRIELPTVRAYLFTIVRNLFLHHVRDEQVSYEEISTALGITVSAAKVKVHRARLKLAEARLAGRRQGSCEERLM
jgi:DNA-directed RNA polymerase specialized sigma24 family protein